MKFDAAAFGEKFAEFTATYVERQLAPLLTELFEVKTELAALKAAPAPKDGRDGADGAPGEKGEPGERGADGAPGLDGKEGPAGRDGADGPAGKDGAAGLAGKDGVSLAGVLKDHEGYLVFTLSDGTLSKVGHVDGKDGAPGKDGANGRDADPEAMQAAIDTAVQKTTLAPLATAYKGVWAPGTYRAGDAVTCAGSLFIAASDTDTKPETGDAWKLAVKRGRDGRDGELKAPAERKAVKL